VVQLQCPPPTPEERIISTMYQNQSEAQNVQRRWPVSVSLGPPERMQLLVYHPPSAVGRWSVSILTLVSVLCVKNAHVVADKAMSRGPGVHFPFGPSEKINVIING
jgi:hypothetical protein